MDIRDVADELHPWAIGAEVPLDQVRHPLVAPGFGGCAKRTRLARDQLVFAHDRADQFWGTFDAGGV